MEIIGSTEPGSHLANLPPQPSSDTTEAFPLNVWLGGYMFQFERLKEVHSSEEIEENDLAARAISILRNSCKSEEALKSFRKFERYHRSGKAQKHYKALKEQYKQKRQNAENLAKEKERTAKVSSSTGYSQKEPSLLDLGGEVPEEKALALATASEQSEALPETQPDMLRNSLDGLTALGSYYQPSRRSESVGTCDNDLSDTACTIMESPTPNNQPEVDRANSTALNMQPTPVTPAQSRTVFEASSPVVERRRTMLDTQVGLARLTTLRKTLNVSKHSDAVAPPGSSPDPFSNSDEIESDLLSNDESNNPEDVSEPNTDSQSTGPSDPSSPLQPYEPISSNITLGIPHNTTSTVVYTQGVSSVGSTPNTSPLSVTSSSSSRIPVRSRGSFSTPTSTSARRAVPNKEITTDSDQQHDGKLSSCSHIDENEFTVPGDNARATVSGSKYPAINRKENSSPASTHTNRGNAPPATSHVMSGGVDKSTNNIEPRVSPGTGPSRRANILKMSPSASMTKANVSPVASAKVQSVRLPLSRTLRQATALSTPTRDSIKQNQKGPAHKASLTIGVPVPGSFVHVQSSSPQGSPSPVTQSHPIVNESLAVPTASTGTKAQFTTWLRSPRHSRQQSQEPKHELVKKSTSLLSRIKGRKSEIRKSLATPPVSTPVQDTSQALMSEADPKPTQPATPQATVSEVNSPARFAATMNSPSFAIRPPTPDSTEGGLADTFSERGVLGGITIAPDTSIPATQELFHTICAYITRHPTNPDSLIFMRLAQILKHAMTRANEVDQATERAKQAALEAKQSAELAELHMQDFHRNSTGLVQRIELAFRAQREANEDVSQDDSDKEN